MTLKGLMIFGERNWQPGTSRQRERLWRRGSGERNWQPDASQERGSCCEEEVVGVGTGNPVPVESGRDCWKEETVFRETGNLVQVITFVV